MHEVRQLTLDRMLWRLQALVEEGKIKYVGLSEVSAEDLRKAHRVHPITAVQLEWSLWTRDAEVSLPQSPKLQPA